MRAAEIHGFRYSDERDLTGFVDGTESPAGRSAGIAAIVADADPEFAGGSYVIVQKCVHAGIGANPGEIGSKHRVERWGRGGSK